MNVCIFCSARELDDKYTLPAIEFANAIAKEGHNLVWGGSDRGLMSAVATAVQENGGKIIGVSSEFFKEKARKNADEMIITSDLTDRKATMLARSDIVVALVGGTGTLDEITEIIALKNVGRHDKPILILNTAGFYDSLKQQLLKMIADGLISIPLDTLVFFADTPQEAIDYIGR